MTRLSESVQAADWKTEKHVPMIECSDKVKSDELFSVNVTLGKAVAYCNIHGLWESTKDIKVA